MTTTTTMMIDVVIAVVVIEIETVIVIVIVIESRRRGGGGGAATGETAQSTKAIGRKEKKKKKKKEGELTSDDLSAGNITNGIDEEKEDQSGLDLAAEGMAEEMITTTMMVMVMAAGTSNGAGETIEEETGETGASGVKKGMGGEWKWDIATGCPSTTCLMTT